MKYVAALDEDDDGWPGGLGNVERPGMGEEKLDNAVYTIRGYADLADMARSVGDSETRRWAVDKARAVLETFEETWWYGGDTRSYADSLVDPGNEKVFQRHWIGLTSTDAVLPRLPFRAAGPLASQEHGNATLNEHEQSCYTGEFGLFHTGTGPTSAPAGNPGASCDSVVSAVDSERSIFTLNSAIAAVSEGNYGRLGDDQQQFYMRGNARSGSRHLGTVRTAYGDSGDQRRGLTLKGFQPKSAPRRITWRGALSTARSRRGSASKTTRSAGAPSLSRDG